MPHDMTIASVTPYLVPGDNKPDGWCARKPWLFVRVETRDGVVGWGEVYTLTHREPSQVALVNALGERLVGTDGTRIKAFVHDVFNDFGEQRIGIDGFAAASGIELALWDALGKTLDVPVYKLLGGACRDTVSLYANLFSERPVSVDTLVAKAVEQVDVGFQALKFYPFRDVADDAEGIARVASVREAVGPDVALAIDLSRRKTPDQARALCHRLEPFDLAWVEDPFPPSNASAYRQLRNQARQPLMTGETLASKAAFLDLVERRASGNINPDICACGGLLELREIGAMVEPHLMTVSAHNYNSMTVGLSASTHAAAGMPNAGLCEYFPELAGDMDHVCQGRLIPESGEIAVPDTPGFGLTFDDAGMTAYRI